MLLVSNINLNHKVLKPSQNKENLQPKLNSQSVGNDISFKMSPDKRTLELGEFYTDLLTTKVYKSNQAEMIFKTVKESKTLKQAEQICEKARQTLTEHFKQLQNMDFLDYLKNSYRIFSMSPIIKKNKDNYDFSFLISKGAPTKFGIPIEVQPGETITEYVQAQRLSDTKFQDRIVGDIQKSKNKYYIGDDIYNLHLYNNKSDCFVRNQNLSECLSHPEDYSITLQTSYF